MSAKPRCRHCRRRNVGRPRGLCTACYYAPGVRGLYPIMSKFCRRGSGIDNCRPLEPLAASAALPATDAKVAALEGRAAAGEALWHPRDARRDLGEPSLETCRGCRLRPALADCGGLCGGCAN